MEQDIRDIVRDLNSKILPNFIKKRSIKKIESILESDENQADYLFDKSYEIFEYIFDNVKSPKALKLIGEMLASKIVDAGCPIPFDALNAKIAIEFCSKSADFIYYLRNVDDKKSVEKLFSLLPEEKIDVFFNSFKNSDFLLRDVLNIIRVIPSKYLPKLVNNLKIDNIIDFLIEGLLDNEIKNLIVNLREHEIIEKVKGSYYFNFDKLLKANIPDQLLDNLIKTIDKYHLLLYMDGRMDISDELKGRIYEVRRQDIEVIINEIVYNYNNRNERISDKKMMYEPMLKEIIEKVDIKALLNEILIVKNFMDERINDLIIEVRKSDIENSILSLDAPDMFWIEYIINSKNISQSLIYQVFPKVPFESMILYEGTLSKLSKDVFSYYFLKNEEKVYEYYKNSSSMRDIANLFFADIPDGIKNNLINMFKDSDILYLLLDDRINNNILLKNRIYTMRKKDVDKVVNDRINSDYQYLVSDSMTQEEKKKTLELLNSASLRSVFPLYNIKDKALLSPNDFILDPEILLFIQSLIHFDEVFNSMNVNNKIDSRKKVISELSYNDLIYIFVWQANKLTLGDDLKKGTLNFMYSERKDEILNYANEHREIYNLLLKIVDEKEVEKILEDYSLNELITVIRGRGYPEYVTNFIINKIIGNIGDTKGLNLFEILPIIEKNTDKFIMNYDKIIDVINKNIPNLNTFVKHAFFDKSDWIGDICSIIDNHEEESFSQICNILLNKIYHESNDSLKLVQSFINLLKNYNRYPELCKNIADLSRDLTDDERLKIEYIFANNDKLEGDMVPKSVEELNKVAKGFLSKVQNLIDNFDKQDSISIKNQICLILFNYDFQTIVNYLDTYGNTYELKKLKFNNQNNQKIIELIDEMIIYVSIMEDILDIDYNDREKLYSLLKNIYDNYDDVSKISMFFSGFEQKMRALYELDSQINLTKISSPEVYNSLLDKELSKKYGVDVLDFSDKEYLLYAHVKSDSETVEELVNGVSSGNKNFICLSAIGNRGQEYFNSSGIIFGYDEMPSGNFIYSSKENMSSNSAIEKNSNVVEEISREQRGILESSDNGLGRHSETLAFREGLKPKYIILPKGKELSTEALEIAKEYGLKVVITQEIGKTIQNPKPIVQKEKVMDEGKKKKEKIQELRLLKDELLVKEGKKMPRKIAILTDSHGLFEPTLAILEDARKAGISEIYSLGDNIGTGPNPAEVIELLEEYKVKSVKGNHELYTLLGTEPFSKHLTDTGATVEAKRNSDWTRSKLTSSQLEIIRNYPDQIELMIGGKKVLLRHHVKDFNTGEIVIKPENYDKIFQGHIHFEESQGKIDTLRGAGIGYIPSNSNVGTASYIIITEKENGGFFSERRNVAFDLNNLGHDINVSDLDDADKDKIVEWTGAKSARK